MGINQALPQRIRFVLRKEGWGIGEEEDDLRRDEGNKERRIVGRRLGKKQGSLVFLG